MRPALALSCALAASLALAACDGADAEDVVMVEDGSERVAELERATRNAAASDRSIETIGEGPDYTREPVNSMGTDRNAVPTDTPETGVAKYDQVGATVCPETQWLSLADYTDPMTGIDTEFEAWLLDESAPEGIVATESGLKYRVVQPGIERGYKPQKFDDVTVHYHGMLSDGRTFDSSYDRDETIEFKPGQVIAGWTEALMGMSPCEARTLYIPAELAYGKRGAGQLIGPDTPLIFHVQILEVDVL